jgi:hypothetical protein
MNSYIEGISIQLYVQCLIVQKNILNGIKTSFNPIKLNAINYYFNDLYIQLNEKYIFITKKKPILSTISFNHCNENNKLHKICKTNGVLNKYQIIIYFKYPKKIKNIKNIKKISTPFILFEEECNEKNSIKLDNVSLKIEKILKKDHYMKDIYENIIIQKS